MIRYVATAARFQHRSIAPLNHSIFCTFKNDVPTRIRKSTSSAMSSFRRENVVFSTSYPYTINTFEYYFVRQLKIVDNLSIAMTDHVKQQKRQLHNLFGEEFYDGYIEKREKKMKKKKKPKPKKELPPKDSIAVCLQKMKVRFDEIEKEPLGPKRGVRTVKFIAGRKCERLHRAVTTKMANTILNGWVYCRHAMQHGFYQLNDMNKKQLAESILGKGTTIKIPDREARIMLKELFRGGKSTYFERYAKMDQAKRALIRKAEIATERNAKGIPKMRNLETREEMIQHGYTEEEIDEFMITRERREKSRTPKKPIV
jgi:hypothetical protein